MAQVLWDTVLFSEAENSWLAARWLGELDAVLCVSTAGDMCLVDCEDSAHAIDAVGHMDDVRVHSVLHTRARAALHGPVCVTSGVTVAVRVTVPGHRASPCLHPRAVAAGACTWPPR